MAASTQSRDAGGFATGLKPCWVVVERLVDEPAEPAAVSYDATELCHDSDVDAKANSTDSDCCLPSRNVQNTVLTRECSIVLERLDMQDHTARLESLLSRRQKKVTVRAAALMDKGKDLRL